MPAEPVTPATDPAVAHLERDLDVRMERWARILGPHRGGLFSIKLDDDCRHQYGWCAWSPTEAVIW